MLIRPAYDVSREPEHRRISTAISSRHGTKRSTWCRTAVDLFGPTPSQEWKHIPEGPYGVRLSLAGRIPHSWSPERQQGGQGGQDKPLLSCRCLKSRGYSHPNGDVPAQIHAIRATEVEVWQRVAHLVDIVAFRNSSCLWKDPCAMQSEASGSVSAFTTRCLGVGCRTKF